ncbi:MAG: conserved hypothetical protein [Marine Group I thaumarchaeote]|nr:MAG: conserved hypothetical protein [Marine Group I thaumarchaeote]
MIYFVMVDAEIAKDQGLSSGKDYDGSAKFKPLKVEWGVANVKTDEAEYYVNEITNQYADLVVKNANIGANKISFEIGSPSMDDITVEDITQRLKEFLEMNVPPFEYKDMKVQ